MGSSSTVICQDCGARTQVNSGGGFTFHLLRCDTCGREREVPFKKLGELHLRYLKGLPGPYSTATAASDEQLKEGYDGEPITEEEYNREVERLQKPCRCKGHFLFEAPERCSKCRSTSLEFDPDGDRIMYD